MSSYVNQIFVLDTIVVERQLDCVLVGSGRYGWLVSLGALLLFPIAMFLLGSINLALERVSYALTIRRLASVRLLSVCVPRQLLKCVLTVKKAN